jgi:hypothetical protein
MVDKFIRFNVSVDADGAVQVEGGDAQDGRGPGDHFKMPVIVGEDYRKSAVKPPPSGGGIEGARLSLLNLRLLYS